MEVRGNISEIWRRPIVKSLMLEWVVIIATAILFVNVGWFGMSDSIHIGAALVCFLMMFLPCGFKRFTVRPGWYFRQLFFFSVICLNVYRALW